jgi:hypothetical protein
MNLASRIAQAIAYENPVIPIQAEDTAFDVAARFLSRYVPEIYEDENDAYLMKVLRNVKRLDAGKFRKNPYLQCVSFSTHHQGDILLSNVQYEAGEILQYDFPDFDKNEFIPHIGFFEETVRFPTVYEGNMPWMSVIPSEINTMKEPIQKAHGHVCVLGLGLGYYAYMAARRENVEDLCIVEKNPQIISLFQEEIFSQFEEPFRKKIRIEENDAFAFMDTVKRGDFDFIFTDIYEGALDGRKVYQKMKKYEEALPDTEFAYWIQKYIR